MFNVYNAKEVLKAADGKNTTFSWKELTEITGQEINEETKDGVLFELLELAIDGKRHFEVWDDFDDLGLESITIVL